MLCPLSHRYCLHVLDHLHTYFPFNIFILHFFSSISTSILYLYTTSILYFYPLLLSSTSILYFFPLLPSSTSIPYFYPLLLSPTSILYFYPTIHYLYTSINVSHIFLSATLFCKSFPPSVLLASFIFYA